MNENFKKFIIIILCIINVALSQEHTYKIEVLSPSSNNEYWWLTRNNKGMNTDKHNINFGWNFKNASTNYKITLSNSFSDNTGPSSVMYPIILSPSYIK